MKVYLYTLFLIFSINLSYSSTCKIFPEIDEYNRSEIVVLAYIREKGDKIFTIDILEVFKGEQIKLGTKLYGLLGDDFINPNVGDTWLLYGTYSDNGIKISTCGYSRSFERPFTFQRKNIPPPINTISSSSVSKQTYNLIKVMYFSRVLEQLSLDIEILRNRKRSIDINKVYKKNNFKQNLTLIFLSLLISLFLFYIFSKRSFT